MMLDVSELDSWMRELFPVRGGTVQMDYVLSALVDDRFRVTMRLIVFDTHDGKESIRDIKEQELDFCARQDAEPKERVQALIQAWASVLPDALGGPAEMDTVMPHDLAPTNAIRLARSRTREDFEKALRAKGRLGRYIAP